MKKFLSLVLALVMTMSLVTISAGAKDFTDAEKVTYTEAVDVISAVKVVDGYTDGSFNPQGTLTRGAAAKIICNLILGPTTASELSADTAPFKDVPADHTFAGYIAYCAKEGIISGYSDGTFRPAGTLTGYAFMKMLLGALGYDQTAEGYTGANWSINVAKQAIGIGLNAGLDGEFNGTKPVTREEACLYAFNTLKATLVEYDEKTTVNVGGAQVVLQGKAQEVRWGTATLNDGNIGGVKDGYVQFAEKHFPKLVQKDDTDVFGRPSWTWVNDKKEIGSYVDYTTLVAEYTDKVTGKDLYELITKSVLDDSDVLVYVDGEYTRASLTEAGVYFTENNIIKSNTEGVGGTGEGVLTQVFVDTDADEVIIAIINTYLAKAAEDYDEKNDEVDLTVYKLDKMATSKAYMKTKDAKIGMTADGEDFAIEDVEKDDLFLVQVADGAIQTMEPAEVLTEKTLTNFKKTSYVTADGEKYNYASTAMYDEDVLDKYDDKNMKEVTYNVVLDKYGYLIGIELNEDPDKYVFLTGVDAGASNLAAKNADANIIFVDGTMDTVTVNISKSELPAYGSQMNTWCTYTVDKNGVYTLKEVTKTDDTADVMQSVMNVTGANEVSIDKKHVSLDGIGGFKKVYGNDDTVYLNVELDHIIDKNNGKVLIIDDVESVTTGVKNVALTVKNAVKKTVGAHDYDPPVNEIYPLFKDNGYIIAAVTIGENEGVTSNYAYITGDVNKEAYDAAEDEWTWTLEAIVNGKAVELTEVGDTLDILDTLTVGAWYEVKYDADGNVRKATPVTFNAADGNADYHLTNSKFISEVVDVEPTVEKEDLALLCVDFCTWDATPASAKANLRYKNGTLYTDVALTEGFSVSPDVKVVLCLAEEDHTPFDKVDDEYTGYAGLEKALRNLDSEKTAFDGYLSAIFENGVATTIVLNDYKGSYVNKGANPLQAMTVTIELVDRDTNRTLETVTEAIYADTTFNPATYLANVTAAGWSNYAVANASTKTVTYVEGGKATVTFFYKEAAPVVVTTQVKVNADNAYVTIGGVQKADGAVIKTVEAGDVLTFTVSAITTTGDDVTTVTDKDGNAIPKTGANYKLSVVEGENEINVTVAPRVHTVSITAPAGFTVKNQSATTGVKGDKITFQLERDTAGIWTLASHAVTGAPTAVVTEAGGVNGKNAVSMVPSGSTYANAEDFAAAGTLYIDSGCTTVATNWIDGFTFYKIVTPAADAIKAVYELSVTINNADIDTTLSVA